MRCRFFLNFLCHLCYILSNDEETVGFFLKNAWNVELRQFFSLEFKNFFHPINFKNIESFRTFFNQMIKNRTKQNDELHL